MRSIETGQTFPLAAVKPLDQLADYREFCLSATRQRLKRSSRPRGASPITGKPMRPIGDVAGLPYSLCAETGSLFLSEVCEPKEWEELLAETSRRHHAAGRKDGKLSQSRTDNVFAPKVDWIRETLAMQGIRRPRILEAVTPPSEMGSLLKECQSFAEVETVNVMELAHSVAAGPRAASEEVIVMLETLDQVDDPRKLLQNASTRMKNNGLLFVTALVASGFDLEVLGLKSQYLYPPDRTNCFSVRGLQRLLESEGFKLWEVSTPGVLDVEIVQAHLQADSELPLSRFERQIVEADPETRKEFQLFLQRNRLSSHARIVAKKQ